MHKVICLFNHKGGVSKTTTAFNLGWKMAEQGKSVLLADFDPQCNLTGMVLGFDGLEDLSELYDANDPNNVRDGLAPAFESKPRLIEGATCTSVAGNQNLSLLPGHIGIAEYETTLGIAQELSGSLLALRNLPGSLRYLLDATAQRYDFDVVLVDMSPSLGPVNQNLLMTSDYFLVPLHPDYFSTMALHSLSRTLPRWKKWAASAAEIEALQNADYPFINPHPLFAGAIIQKYRPRSGKASKAFQRWIDQLEDGIDNILLPALRSADMVDEQRFEEATGHSPAGSILEVPDFNSLIALSQEHQTPIYALTQDQLGQRGAIFDQSQESMERFNVAFTQCSEKLLSLAFS